MWKRCQWAWCALLHLHAAAAMCWLTGSCGTSKSSWASGMLWLGPAGTTDAVQDSTTWKQPSGSAVKNNIEWQRNSGEFTLYYCIIPLPKFLFTVCCSAWFWGWLVLFFALNTVSQICGRISVSLDPRIFFCERTFLFPQCKSTLFCLRCLWLSHSLIFFSDFLSPLLDFLGFVWFWFVRLYPR